MLTREQLRAARAARGWGVRDLAAAVAALFPNGRVSAQAISAFENGADSRVGTLQRIRTTLEAEGFSFGPPHAPTVGWPVDAPERWRATGDDA